MNIKNKADELAVDSRKQNVSCVELARRIEKALNQVREETIAEAFKKERNTFKGKVAKIMKIAWAMDHQHLFKKKKTRPDGRGEK